jgi:branched-chain amino acid transport system permease protein
MSVISTPTPSGPPISTASPPSTAPRGRVARLVGLLVLVAVVLLVPRILDANSQSIVDLILLACLGSIGLNLVLGIAGQISIANSAFLCIGGYVAASMSTLFGWPMLPTLLLSGVAGLVIGALVGLPALRVRGLYLVVATLALYYIVIYAAQQYQQAEVGQVGFVLPIPNLFGVAIDNYSRWYFVLVITLALVVLGVQNLMRTSFGRAWLAIRSIERTAEIIGVNVPRYKILVFALSSFICSLEGGLFAYYNGAVSYETFTFAVAVQYAAMVVIGGMGSITGSILGAALLTWLPFGMQGLFSNSAEGANYQLIIYGVAMALFLVLAPDGIVGLFNRLRVFAATRWSGAALRRIGSSGVTRRMTDGDGK